MNDIDIPACPRILQELRKEIDRDAPDFRKVERLVSSDVAFCVLVARQLQSPVYGASRKVSGVGQALAVLGSRRLRFLLTGAMIRQSLACDWPGLEEFWEISNMRANAMAQLARRRPAIDPELARMLGLLCDMGVPPMIRRFPDYPVALMLEHDLDFGLPALRHRFPAWASELDQRHDGARRFTDIEYAKYGLDHAQAGARLARAWDLGDVLSEAILRHHDVTVFWDPDASREVQELVAMRLIAEHAVQMHIGRSIGAEWERGRQSSLALLGWSERELADWMSDAGEELAEARV